MNKRILVTGSNGFVGNHLIKELESHFVLTKMVFSDAKSDEIACDLSKNVPEQVAVQIQKSDQIIHLAALTPKSKEDNLLSKAENFYESNLTGTLHLLNCLKGKKLEHFIYISTLDVYGINNKEIDESTPTNPETYYSASKLASEEACKIFCKEENIPLAILRLGHIYGPGEGLYKKVIPVFISKAIKKEPLTIFGTGKALRNFIYVKDVARAISLIAENKNTGIYNIVGNNSISISELAQMINKMADNESSIEYPAKDFSEVDFIFKNDRLSSIGFRQKTSLKEGLQEEMDFLMRQA